MNPQQSAQDVLGLDLWTEAKQAAGGQLILGAGIGWKQSVKGPFILFHADFRLSYHRVEQEQSRPRERRFYPEQTGKDEQNKP